MIRRVKPANSDSIPINANIGSELAVSGSVSATIVSGAACSVATGSGGWAVAVTGTSSPVGWTSTISTVLKVSTGTASVISIGSARTGSFTITASSIALFFG